jgi:hypothetical protein
VRELVLVDGWAGPGGSSLLSIAPDWFAGGIRQIAADRGEGWRIPAPAPAVVGVSDAGDAAWLQERLTDHPLRSFTDRTELADGAAIPTLAILAPDGPVAFAEMAAAVGSPTLRLQGGHDLMITSPDPLATALLELA